MKQSSIIKKNYSLNKSPLISVVMNCHNGEKYLAQSIRSVIKQTYKNWELIFYDNTSKDNSLNLAKTFKDKRIFIYHSKKYLNLYSARNKAIKLTKGKYIAFLDTDDYWDKHKLKKQLFFILNNNLKISYTDVLILNETNKKIFNKINKKQLVVNTQKLLNNYDLGMITSMIDKSVLKNFRFNEKFEIIGDFDFFINLSLYHKIGYLNKPLAIYRIHNQNLSIRRIDLHIKELSFWLTKNKKKFKKLKISLFWQKIYFYKLIIKKFLKFFKFGPLAQK